METSVSRYRDVQLIGPLNHLGPSQHYSIEVFKGNPEIRPNYAERCLPFGQPMGYFPVWNLLSETFVVPSGKLTTTTCTDIREAGASWHHGGLTKVPLKPYDHHDNMVSRGVRGALK